MQPIWDAIAWQCRVAASGVFPKTDMYGSLWPEHSVRSRLAGKAIFGVIAGKTIKAVLVEISGDLDEYPKSVGLPDYRATYGCIRCFKSRAQFGDLEGRSRKRSHQWVLDCAASSLSHHKVCDEDFEALKQSTKCLKTKAGAVVTARMAAFPEIRKGDRIEPAVCTDVDIWHGQRCTDFKPENQRLLVYRRPRNALLHFPRLLTIPGIQPGAWARPKQCFGSCEAV